jgi:predicted nucleic acid-binding protein
LAEAFYLSENGRVPLNTIPPLLNRIRDKQSVLLESPPYTEIVEEMHPLSREQIPHMPDRLIATTALHLGIPVISRDRKIQASGLWTIW